MRRVVVAQLWAGAQVVKLLGADDPEPTQAELDEIAVAWLPWNDTVMPNVRVMEEFSIPAARGIGGASGPAGGRLPR